MKQNLKTKEGRHQAITAMENECLQELKKIITLPETVIIELQNTLIQILLQENSYMGITLYREYKMNNRLKLNEISFPYSGSFNKENKAAFERIIIVAEILKQWDSVCKIVNNYCKKYSALISEIREINNI